MATEPTPPDDTTPWYSSRHEVDQAAKRDAERDAAYDRAHPASLDNTIAFLDKMTPDARRAWEAGRKNGTSGARPADPLVAHSMTDASHAERFAESFGLDIRYDHRRDRFLIYQDPIWRPDVDGKIYRLAIQFARMRQAEALDIADKKQRETAIKYFINAESKASLDRTVALAKCLRPIADAGDMWDIDPMLLGCPNGILDLNRGKLIGGDPNWRITMSTNVQFDPDAVCPRWVRFIDQIFEGDQELAAFVQRYIGYSLTGKTGEQVLAFAFGRGANGKGTMMNTISHILGDYAYNMPFSTVELRQRSAIPNDIAALEKRRWVIASETNDGTRLNESRIKALTGCDPITARFLHGEWFTFQPVAKFFLSVNHKPIVVDDSYGFWRRIRLVPFTRTFVGADVDPTLEGIFHGEEAAGILNWAIDGCLAWQRDGLGQPTAVVAATSAYQTDSDPLNDFFEACVEVDIGGFVKAQAIQQMYAKWADIQRLAKHERFNAKVLGSKLADKVARRHTRDGWVYDGIRLITNNLFE